MDIPLFPVVHPWALFLRLGGSDPDKQMSIMPSCSGEQGVTPGKVLELKFTLDILVCGF